jgi:hypothetical protein
VPLLHHDHAVGEVGDDTHVVGDQHDPGVDAVAQVAHELEDLGLHRDVERGRRLVGDEQLRVAAPAPGRSSPAAAGRRTAGAGRSRRAARRRDLDELEQLDRPLSAALADIDWWLRSISAIWNPTV